MTSIHVDSGREWRGGQAQVLHLARGLIDRGHRAIIVAPADSPLLERAAQHGVSVETLALRGEWDVASIVGLIGVLARVRPDVVHSHTAHAVTMAGIAARVAGVPLTVASRRVDFPVSWLGRHKLERLADVVVCVSDAIRAVLESCGVADERLEVVHSGIAYPPDDVDATAVAALRRELAGDDAPLIGTIGALVDHKDHRTLVEAAAMVCAQYPSVRFVIVGAGPLEAELRALARQRGVADAVRFLGFRDDVAIVLRTFDLFVLSSKLEGLGTAVLDAMAARVPVVATRTGGVPEMIENEHSGLLVAPSEPRRLADAIVRLLGDVALRQTLAATASGVVAERFTIQSTVDRTAALYERWLTRTARRPAL